MKNTKKILSAISILAVSFFSANAQETSIVESIDEEKESSQCCSLDVGMDVVSSYVWRGLKSGTGASIQPYVEYTSYNFTLGAWNNISTGSAEAFEVNLYASYAFPFGVTIGATDYFNEGNVFGNNFDDLAETHAIEPFIQYDYYNLSFFGGLMFFRNDHGENTQDFYGEVSYTFEKFDLAIGAGDGQYVTSPEWGTVGEFAICNISISKEKNITVTDTFSIPVKGAVTLNPYTERFYAYVGISL
ncbi:MAG: hypothetical protein R6U95_00470 [Bacteroidales bacterium]